MSDGNRRRPVFTPQRKWRGKQIRFVRNRFIIRLRDSVKTEEQLEQQLDAALEGLDVIRPYRFLGDVVVVDIRGPADGDISDRELLARIDRLKARADVGFVEPDLRLSPLALPVDEHDDGPQDANDEQWGWLHIGMEDVWQTVTGSNDVVIAILDSALYEHTDFDFTRMESIINIEDPAATAYSNIEGEAGHGTRVCGLVAASTDNDFGVSGVNTASPIRYYRVDVPGEVATTASNLLEAVLDVIAEAAPRNRRAVINMSWAADLQDVATNVVQAEALETLGTICDVAEESGAVLLCCGAGNHIGATQWPARFANDGVHTCVIAVGGTSLVAPPAYSPGDEPPPERLAVLASGYADEYLWSQTPSDLNVTVVAPGDNLKVLAITPPEQVAANAGVDLRKSTDAWDGTSLAVGFVTGAASLVWSVHPTLPPAGVVSALRWTASQADGLAKPASGWGHGRIEVALALDAIHPTPIVDAIMDLSLLDRKKLQAIAEMIRKWLEPFNPRFQMEVLGPDGRSTSGRLDRVIATGNVDLLGASVGLNQQINAAMNDIEARYKNPTLVRRPTGIVFVTNRNDQEEASEEVVARLAASGTRIHVVREAGLDGISDALATLVTETGGMSWSLDASKDMTMPRNEALAHLYEAAGWRVVEGLSTNAEVDEHSASLISVFPADCTFVDFVATVPESCAVVARLSVDGRPVAEGDPGVRWETQKGLHIVRLMPRLFPAGEWRYDVSIDGDDAAAYGEERGQSTVPIGILAAGNLPNANVVID